jgi:hypothetical protein
MRRAKLTDREFKSLADSIEDTSRPTSLRTPDRPTRHGTSKPVRTYDNLRKGSACIQKAPVVIQRLAKESICP